MGFADFINVVGTIASAVSSTPVKSQPQTGEIYRIWFSNDQSGKSYIGQTMQGTLVRVNQHINDAKSPGNGGCPLLDEATRYFGVSAMQYEILESGIKTHSALDAAEKKWIAQYKTQYPNGYNIKSGGQGRDGLINGMTPQQAFADMMGKRGESILSALGSVLSSPIVGDIVSASAAKVQRNRKQ